MIAIYKKNVGQYLYVSRLYLLGNPTATSSEFELKTTIAAPDTASITPIKSRFLNTSFNISGAKMTLATKVVVPSGAMVEAGANPYATRYVNPLNMLPSYRILTNKITNFSQNHQRDSQPPQLGL